MSNPVLTLSEAVAEGLASGRAVVALETTLLAHGLPKDRSLDVARELESICLSEGAVPATIAILHGQVRVGLEPDSLEILISGNAKKASLRDISAALALGGAWATTVASTTSIACRAGIRWFATGGIGGVHRGASSSFDESADLLALARYPVGVVCAGAKSVLDLPKTVERLETLGVPVLGFQTDVFPAFYCRESGLSVSARVESEKDAAKVAIARFDRLNEGGLLVCRPPPKALPRERVEKEIEAALHEAGRLEVRGSALTPFLLSRLHAFTDGDSIEANIELIKANCRLAAKIAVADAALRSV